MNLLLVAIPKVSHMAAQTLTGPELSGIADDPRCTQKQCTECMAGLFACCSKKCVVHMPH